MPFHLQMQQLEPSRFASWCSKLH